MNRRGRRVDVCNSGFWRVLLPGRPLLLPLLLLMVVVVLLLRLAEAYLDNAESAGKLPLHNELSTRALARINVVKVMTG